MIPGRGNSWLPALRAVASVVATPLVAAALVMAMAVAPWSASAEWPGPTPPAPALGFRPNPARGPLMLRFALPREAHVRLAIYDLSGRRVRALASGPRPAGEHALAWDLRDEHGAVVRAGLYFARLEADGRVVMQKLVTLK